MRILSYDSVHASGPCTGRYLQIKIIHLGLLQTSVNCALCALVPHRAWRDLRREEDFGAIETRVLDCATAGFFIAVHDRRVYLRRRKLVFVLDCYGWYT